MTSQSFQATSLQLKLCRNHCFSRLLYDTVTYQHLSLCLFINTELSACGALHFCPFTCAYPQGILPHADSLFFQHLSSYSLCSSFYHLLYTVLYWYLTPHEYVLLLPQVFKLSENKDNASSLWVCLAYCLVYGGYSVDVHRFSSTGSILLSHGRPALWQIFSKWVQRR